MDIEATLVLHAAWRVDESIDQKIPLGTDRALRGRGREGEGARTQRCEM